MATPQDLLPPHSSDPHSARSVAARPRPSRAHRLPLRRKIHAPHDAHGARRRRSCPLSRQIDAPPPSSIRSQSSLSNHLSRQPSQHFVAPQGTHSEQAAYEFTTLTCIPGVIHYNDAKIQLLDLPGIIEGASEGKGRGRQVRLRLRLRPWWRGMGRRGLALRAGRAARTLWQRQGSADGKVPLVWTPSTERWGAHRLCVRVPCGRSLRWRRAAT